MESQKPKIPRLIGGIDLRSLPLGPMEGFVLSRIDASATLADIADLTSLELAEVVRIVDKLHELGVIDWADGHVSYPRATPRASVPPRSSPNANAGTSRPPEPLQRHVTEIPKAIGPHDPVAQRAAVRVFASPPGRAPQLDRLGTPTGSTPPPASGSSAPARARPAGDAGLHAERPSAEEHVGPRPGALPPPAAPGPAATAGPPPAVVPDATRSATPATPPPAGPAPAPSDGIELPMERRKRIDDLYVALDLLDHYEVLGVSRKADKAKIRSSYFEGSKAFHPDTVFRKNVGGYRSRMEAIFTRLTEAYEVLGKKKAREEYDAYLASLGETRAAEEALSGEHEVPAEIRGEPPPEADAKSAQAPAPTTSAAPSPPPPTTSAPLSPPPTSSTPAPSHESQRASGETAPAKQSAPTEEGRRVAREVLQKRMDAMRTASRPRPPGAPPISSVPPVSSAPPAEPRSQKEALRDLTSSLRGAAALTGGLDQVTRHVAEAKRALEQSDLANAVRAYRLAFALAPERADIERELTKYAKELAISLADRYETQALYEERYKKWASAATSWAKVIEGRPDDSKAMTHAAIALIEAKGDLHQARRFAQKATELAPNDAAARRALGRVFLAAGLGLNARRELELARTLEPNDELTRLLLRELDTQRS